MSAKEALKRVNSFVAAGDKAAKKRTKAGKKAVKKLDKRSKMSPKQKVRQAHDKIEDKLDRIAKKYKVSIKLNRNKNKLPSVVVSGLKKLSYGDSAKLFSEIPNSSPVPQKMNGNSALFRVFTKRKVTASEEKTYVVTAKKNGKRMFWTDEGFKEVKASEASILDEEMADKIERRAKAKGWDSKTVPSEMTADDNSDDSANSDNTDTSSDDTSSDNSSDDSGDESDDEIAANKADIVAFVNKNGLTRDDLMDLTDNAIEAYSSDVKDNAPVEDLIDLCYDMLGKDEVKTSIRALVNKKSMSGESEGNNSDG